MLLQSSNRAKNEGSNGQNILPKERLNKKQVSLSCHSNYSLLKDVKIIPDMFILHLGN